MMKMIMYMMMSLSIMMMNLNNPLTMSMMILIQTILICLVSRLINSSSWISLTLFLIMVGGLMIIFSYIISITINKKFKIMNFKLFMFYMIIPFNLMNFKAIQYFIYDNIQLMDFFNLEFMKLFLPLNMLTSLFMFIYLLITLIIMINILKKNKGPLRKKY